MNRRLGMAEVCVFLSCHVLGCSSDPDSQSGSGGVGAATSGGSSQVSAGGAAAGGVSTGGGATSSGGKSSTASGGSVATGGASSAGTGGVPSTAGLPFVGSCLMSSHCTDEWDNSLGVDTLSAICTSQAGTWSTSHCDPALWKKKCTQAVLGGVYVQFLPDAGACVLGVEEPL